MIEVAHAGMGGEHHKPQPGRLSPLLKCSPRDVPDNGHPVEIVHPGAAERAIGHRKSRGLYDMGLNSKARAEPQNCAGILRDVGLKQR